MSISAIRHKYLDKETNIGTLDLRDLVTDDVYTAAIDRAGTVLSSMGGMGDSIANMLDNISNMASSSLKNIKKALDNVIDKLLNSKVGQFVKGVLDKLKGLNLGGLKDFLKSAIKAGTNFVCNNLDMMKNMALGLTLGSNILQGLLLGLALSWLDQYCKGFSQKEWAKSNNKDLLSLTFGNAKIGLTKDNVLDKVGGALSGVLKGKSLPSLTALPGPSEIVSQVLDNGFQYSAKTMEVSSSMKTSLVSKLDEAIGTVAVGGSEYMKLLKARGDIITAPIVSTTRKLVTNGSENASGALGAVAKELVDIDLESINTNTLNSTQKGLLDVAKNLKYKASDTDIHTRDDSRTAFITYDWEGVTSSIDSSLKDEVMKMKPLEESMGFAGLHPTTAVFIEDTVEGVGKKISPVGGGTVNV